MELFIVVWNAGMAAIFPPELGFGNQAAALVSVRLPNPIS